MRRVLTVANLLTLGRLLLCIPIFYMLVTNVQPAYVFLVFGLAALTDLLDGYAARKRNEESELGKLLDPVADKILVVGTLLALAMRGSIPLLWLVVLAAKELAMLIGGALLVGRARSVIAARPLGKISTVFLLIGILLLLANFTTIGRPLVGIGVIVSLAAGLDYLIVLLRK